MRLCALDLNRFPLLDQLHSTAGPSSRNLDPGRFLRGSCCMVDFRSSLPCSGLVELVGVDGQHNKEDN